MKATSSLSVSFLQVSENKRLMEDLKTRSFMGIFFIAFIALTILFTYDLKSRHPEIVFSFLVPLITVCSFRAVHLFFFSRFANSQPIANSAVFFSSVLLTGLIWGIGFLEVMMKNDEYPSQILMVMVTAGICSGGVVAYIPNRFLSLSYNILMMWPTALYLSFFSTFQTAGVLFFLYSLYLFIISTKGNEEYWKAINNEELLRKQSARLEVLSKVDVLTDLFNRRQFETFLEQEWRRAVRNCSPLSMLVFDLDDFKRVNDEKGHLAGDEVIRYTARNLKSIFKRVTDVVCRYGGEEFVVLLSGDRVEAEKLAEKMCRLQEETIIPYQGLQLRNTISIGLASITPDRETKKETLFARADQALYKAKKAGKNRFETA